ncbi:hypothetical protein CDAR_442971 [Caerostris darwini]|uniref:Uncharacterized protein n=1 Tax=Caerostris darwini TaxID=1538125 RepID=A0AAV4VNH9_9ARAC|nr:hypothetical protein CDAR_442971 [Caerostris darwini]
MRTGHENGEKGGGPKQKKGTHTDQRNKYFPRTRHSFSEKLRTFLLMKSDNIHFGLVSCLFLYGHHVMKKDFPFLEAGARIGLAGYLPRYLTQVIPVGMGRGGGGNSKR